MREERNGRDGLVTNKADQSYHEEVGSVTIMRWRMLLFTFHKRGEHAFLFPNTSVRRHQLCLMEGDIGESRNNKNDKSNVDMEMKSLYGACEVKWRSTEILWEMCCQHCVKCPECAIQFVMSSQHRNIFYTPTLVNSCSDSDSKTQCWGQFAPTEFLLVRGDPMKTVRLLLFFL